MDKFLVKKPKAKKAKAKKAKPAKKVIQVGKQVAKVKTGSVVQIDLSRRVQPRTTTNRDLNRYRAEVYNQSLTPVMAALSGQQVAAQSNIERLQFERDRLRQEAMKYQNERVKALEQGKSGAAIDAMKRARTFDKASQNIGTEIRVRESEIQSDPISLPSISTQTEAPEPEAPKEAEAPPKKGRGRPAKPSKEVGTSTRPVGRPSGGGKVKEAVEKIERERRKSE